MRMLSRGLQLEEIDDVDETNLQVGELRAKQRRCRERLLRGDVSGRHDYQVGLTALIVAGPVPNPNALAAMADRLFHIEVLQVHLLVGDDDVDVILAAQTM